MVEVSLIVLIALMADWLIGDPPQIWSRVPHPIVLFGRIIAIAEKYLLTLSDKPAYQMRKGAVAMSAAILVALGIGLFTNWLITQASVAGPIIEGVIVTIFLAQRSLHDHVKAVLDGFEAGGIEKARQALSMIVGRDPAQLDESGVSRAAIESLAENFSDGVVAPAFWYLVFGLPGLFVYKMINTADSMIAYKNERYEHFGFVAAKIDDLANWLPARLSALIVLLAGGLSGFFSRLSTVLRDAQLHNSPNAGWPEASMAANLDIALGGARVYGGKRVSQAALNASGRDDLGRGDIARSLGIFFKACLVLWALVGLMILVSFW